MQKFISLLRGINVGGHRKIRMADLKTMFVNLGFKTPITYIQSGNIIFDSEIDDVEIIESLISKAILDTFGYQVPVLVKTSSDFEFIVSNNPYYSDLVDTKKLHFTFLSRIPSSTEVKSLEQTDFGVDKFKIIGDIIYLRIESPYHKTKLSNLFFEKQLKVSTTTRNWNTSNRLAGLLKKES